MNISGAEDIIGLLDTMISEVQVAVREATDEATGAVYQAAREITSYEFQTVPSYLLYYKIKPETGAREYTPGTYASFSRATVGGLRSINPEDFVGQKMVVQRGPGDTHPVHDLLVRTTTVVQDSVAQAAVGYEGDPPKAVYWTMFGTRGHQVGQHFVGGMIARPYLEQALVDNRKLFFDLTATKVRDAVFTKAG